MSRGLSSEPQYTHIQKREDSPFYCPNIDHKLTKETQELLERYSHVPKERQSEHVHSIREKAWDIRAYPCIGLGLWLTPQLRRLPAYPELLDRVQHGATVMDVGTFLGHDLRRLVFDGAPSDHLYGVDIVNHFDVGYECFRDRDHFNGHFIEADILAGDPQLDPLKGRVDIVIISQVMHQWNLDRQMRAAEILTTFTKPGSLVVGNQSGNPQAHQIFPKTIPEGVWRHNAESFARMWDDIGERTHSTWETQAWLRSYEEMGWESSDVWWLEPEVGILEFVVRRLS